MGVHTYDDPGPSRQHSDSAGKWLQVQRARHLDDAVPRDGTPESTPLAHRGPDGLAIDGRIAVGASSDQFTWILERVRGPFGYVATSFLFLPNPSPCGHGDVGRVVHSPLPASEQRSPLAPAPFSSRGRRGARSHRAAPYIPVEMG